jgi:hypothetical protein
MEQTIEVSTRGCPMAEATATKRPASPATSGWLDRFGAVAEILGTRETVAFT